jgi:hypothetical protein
MQRYVSMAGGRVDSGLQGNSCQAGSLCVHGAVSRQREDRGISCSRRETFDKSGTQSRTDVEAVSQHPH